MSYSDDGLTNSKMEWSSLISVLMMVILTNSDSDFVDTIIVSKGESMVLKGESMAILLQRTRVFCGDG